VPPPEATDEVCGVRGVCADVRIVAQVVRVRDRYEV